MSFGWDRRNLAHTDMGGAERSDRKYKFIFEQLSKDWEYRTKLSEVAFSSNSFFTMAFRSAYMKSLGRDGKHPQGSLKVIKNLVAWMDEHKEQIAAFDDSRPTLPQLNLLTPDQLKAAIQFLDPLYD